MAACKERIEAVATPKYGHLNELPSAGGVGQVHFVQSCTMLEQMSERKSQGQQRSPECHGPSATQGRFLSDPGKCRVRSMVTDFMLFRQCFI